MDSSARSSDPLEHRVETAEPAAGIMDSSEALEHRVETAEPAAGVMDSSARSRDPLEHRPEEGVETAEPAAGIMGSSPKSSDPLGYQAATPGRDPEEAAVEDARVRSSSARVNDTSEPEDRPLMTTSWILPEVSTSTGVDTGAMPTTDLEQAA